MALGRGAVGIAGFVRRADCARLTYMDGWDDLTRCWRRTLDAVDALGGITTFEAARTAGITHSDRWGLRIAEPASEVEIEEVEAALGRGLPPTLRNIFASHAARVHFQWQLPEDLELPDGLTDLFGGGFTLSLADLPRLERNDGAGWRSFRTRRPPMMPYGMRRCP